MDAKSRNFLLNVWRHGWLANLETPIIPDISTVPITPRELLQQALQDQDGIGWTLGV